MARFTEVLLAKRDDPIFREGLTVFTPYTARSPRARNPRPRSRRAIRTHAPRLQVRGCLQTVQSDRRFRWAKLHSTASRNRGTSRH